MTTSLRACKTGLVLLLFISSCLIFTGVQPSTVEARQKILTFPSYLNIDYDENPLNNDLAIDKSISVPVNVTYTTDIPTDFGRFLPWQIRNIILFGSMIGPMQKIHLEIVDAPDWADIYLSQQDIFVNIPLKGDSETAKTSLVISPREEAPAVPQSIEIKATSTEIGRITGREIQLSVSFTPKFIPTITISPEEPTRTVGPRQTVNFKIDITNNGNKKIRVTPTLVGVDDEWTPTMNPPFLDIQAAGEGTFTYSIYTPYYFGWHNEIESFQLDFTAQIFPIRPDAPVGGPYSIYLRVNNYGFSTPGFEVFLFFAAFLIVAYLMKRKYNTS